MPLHPGDNVVVVTAKSADATGPLGTTDTITITHNPYLSFTGPVAMSPTAALVGEPVEVTVRIGILVNDSLVTSSVRVVTVDADNSVLGDLIPLADDGNTVTGDEIAGDGVYSGTHTFTESAKAEIRLRVVAETLSTSGNIDAFSEVFTFSAVEPLTLADASRMEAIANEAETTYTAIEATDGHVEAAAQTTQWLLSQPDVLQAGPTNAGYAV